MKLPKNLRVIKRMKEMRQLDIFGGWVSVYDFIKARIEAIEKEREKKAQQARAWKKYLKAKAEEYEEKSTENKKPNHGKLGFLVS